MITAKIRRSVFCIMAISFLLAPAFAENNENGVAVLRQTGKAFAEVAKSAIPAVISVRVEKDIQQESPNGRQQPFGEDFFEHFFGPRYRYKTPAPPKQIGQGSGFIISEDGYILSNNHVVGDADKITVTLNDGREFHAELIGADRSTDVAVIKIDGENLPFIELGDSDALKIGEWAIAVGNPFGLNASVTVGVVSAKGRSNLNITGQGGYEDFIQTDAAINPGNSGGPLLNIDGKAVGLNTAIFSRSGGYMGIGFAIPINLAKNIKDQLVKFGKVERGFIGIVMDRNEITPDLAELFGLKVNYGVIINKIIDGSPAEKAGLKADDIILELNGEKVKNHFTFRNSIAMLKPGTRITLVVFRDGKEEKFKLSIGSQQEGQALLNVSSKFAMEFGIVVEDITEELAKKFGHNPGEGVIVSQVTEGSAARQKGIEPGMAILSVNRTYITSVTEFNKKFDELEERNAKTVWLLVKQQGFATYVVLNRN